MTLQLHAATRVIYDGRAPFEDWQIATPVEGASVEQEKEGLRFVLKQWEKGKDGWPRVLFKGTPVDLSDYSQVRIIIENLSATEWQNIVAVVSSSPDHRSSSGTAIRPGARHTLIVDLSDGVVPDPSAIREISFFLQHPQKDHFFRIHRIEAVANPDYSSTRAAYEERHRMVKAQLTVATQSGAGQPVVPAQKALHAAEEEAAIRKSGYLRRAVQALEEAEGLISRIGLSGAKGSLVIWQSPLGMPMRDITLPPYGTEPFSKLHHRIALNDYKALCLNFSPTAKKERVTVEIEGDPLFRLKPTYLAIARDGTQTADAIGEAATRVELEIPHHETRQVILWLDTRSTEPEPGRHHAILKVTCGEETRTFPLEVEVASLRLPDQVGVEIQNWAYFFVSQVTVTRGLEKEALANLRDYGVNTFILRYEQAPLPKLDAQGRYLGLDHLERFTQVMDHLKPLPHENLVIWLPFHQEAVVELFKEEAVLAAYHRDLRELLDRYGVAPERRYLKFIDEPKLEFTVRSLDWMERARKADPTLRFYDNGTTLLGERDQLARFLQLVDLYQPNWDGIVARHRDNPGGHIERLQQAGVKNIGFYRCLMSRKNHGVNIYEYYRLGFWRMARYGMGNIGFWVYNAGHGEDEWDGRKGRASGGTVVYQRDGKLLTSRRWELFREGLSDYRLLHALSKATGPVDLRRHRQLLETAESLLNRKNDPAAADAVYQQLLPLGAP